VTKRRFRNFHDLTHREFCTGELEHHVQYEIGDNQFRVVVRCACGAVRWLGRRLYRNYAEAEAASRVVLEKEFSA
jgi:hypothetical protein